MPEERIDPVVVVEVDPAFREVVEQLVAAAHKIKSERVKLEAVLDEFKKFSLDMKGMSETK